MTNDSTFTYQTARSGEGHIEEVVRKKDLGTKQEYKTVLDPLCYDIEMCQKAIIV